MRPDFVSKMLATALVDIRANNPRSYGTTPIRVFVAVRSQWPGPVQHRMRGAILAISKNGIRPVRTRI